MEILPLFSLFNHDICPLFINDPLFQMRYVRKKPLKQGYGLGEVVLTDWWPLGENCQCSVLFPLQATFSLALGKEIILIFIKMGLNNQILNNDRRVVNHFLKLLLNLLFVIKPEPCRYFQLFLSRV